MVSTRAQRNTKQTRKVYYESNSDSEDDKQEVIESSQCTSGSNRLVDYSDTGSESSYSDNESDTGSESSDSGSESSDSGSESCYSDNESSTENDPDYEYESASDCDEYDDLELAELTLLHNQLKRWKQEHNIEYDDILLMHTLMMLKHVAI